MCAQDKAGVTDFTALRSATYTAPQLLVFFAFDLLQPDGQNLRREPLIDRRLASRTSLGLPIPPSASTPAHSTS